MSDSAQNQQQPPRPKRPLWRRLLRRVFVVGSILVLLALLILGAGVWYASHNRVRLANRALQDLGSFRGQLEAVQLDRHGNFDVRGLELADKATGKTVVRLPKITGKFEWGALRSNSVESLVLENPEIHLDEMALKAFTTSGDSPAVTGAEEGAQGFAGLRIDKLQLKDAKVSFTDKDGTRHEVDVNYLADKLAVDSQGLLNTGEQQLTISHEDLDMERAPYGVRLLEAKGRIKDGVVDLDEVNVQQPVLHATPQVLGEFGVDVSGGTAAPKSLPTTGPLSQGKLGLIRGIRVGKLGVKDLSVSTRGFTPGNPTGIQLPDTGIVIPRYEADELSWKLGEPLHAGAQRLLFQDLKVASETDEGVLNIRELSVALNPKEDAQPWTVRYLRINDPNIHWTHGLHQALQEKVAAFGMAKPPSPPAQQSPATPPSTAPPPAETTTTANVVRIMKAGITGATVKISDRDLMPFDLMAHAGLMLTEIEFGAQGWKSQSFQSLEVTEGKLQFPAEQGAPDRAPFFELPAGELVMKPDEWNENRKVARLSLEKPVVRLRDGNTPWIPHGHVLEGPPYPVPVPSTTKDQPAEQQQQQPQPSSDIVAAVPLVGPPAPIEQPWWKRLHYGQLTVKDGFTDLVLFLPRPVDMQAKVNITTERTTTGGSRHRVRIEDFAGKLPTLSKLPFPVLQAGVLEGSVLLPEMWSQRRIEELKLTGANIEVGEALMKLFEPEKNPKNTADTSATTTPPSTTAQPGDPWRVGLLQVADSSVSLQHIIPGLQSVHFGLAFEVHESPLLMEDILKDATPQRIELANIRIPSVQDPDRSVAELEKIAISLSLQGLARKEIDHIEIVNPTLYVGEDLFWYVDYYRKYMAGGTPSPEGPQMVAADDDFEFAVSSAVIESEPPLSEAAWSIKRLQVHDGKLIISPKGKPLFKTPFPFKVDTEVTRGTLQADLEIPPDTYPIPQIDLKLVGMRGRVQFNLPFKQKDNNLTETFEVDSIQYDDFKTGKAFLTVTYDKAGIYAKFGAEAYEGYLNGEANVYLTDSYHWDGWVTGKNVETKHLAQILTPTYFFMEGKVETSLVAQGSMDELYQGDASFKNLTPGKISIKALDDVIKDLPKEWDPLRQQITKIGLETMRDFAYDRAEMKTRFYGREGNGYLRFIGPQGSRNFDINVYDHRWTDDNADKKPAP
ncbi:hypothetical protein [Roseimicrobium sp. ORNL1]|uniref:hypothetical protein n=1 Tax=Roseimicrobium sp. ORNL1 TaxID=2711231 RepID=UPI0013E18334|nr:hypothetical protein [Roseimicrobium sp. ORNL1]QIF05083.1 hypothetical protein G5S37_27410 [Roseimicrobium sp. ORNL1]